MAVTVLLFSRNSLFFCFVHRRFQSYTNSVKIVEETGGFFRGKNSVPVISSAIISSFLFSSPPSLYLSFQRVNKTMYAFRWVFLWGSGVITGSRVDFNPVNESVKKLVFCGRVKKEGEEGDESIISAEISVRKPLSHFPFRSRGRCHVLARTCSERSSTETWDILSIFFSRGSFRNYLD